MNDHSFLTELKRRNVIRMAGLYLIGAWLLVQVAGTILPMFDAPAWLPRTIVILLAIGFVPAAIFSWIFELTPAGLKRDEDVRPDESIAPQTARRMNRLVIAVLVLALGYFAVDKFVLAPRRAATPNESPSTLNKKFGQLALVEARVGETESALDHLEQLLAAPAGWVVSAASLRFDPAWDPLRENPRFKALLAKHAVDEKNAAP